MQMPSDAWAQFGGGHGGHVLPLFQTGGHNMPCPPTFFSLGFVFGEVSKTKVCHVLCDELFMLDGRPHIAMLMLKQKFGAVSPILLVYKFLASIK